MSDLKERVKENGSVIALLLAVILFSATFGFLSAALVPTGPAVVQPGTQTLSCTYNVFTDGVNTFARNCVNGMVDYSSANDSYVIQSAINAAIAAPVNGKSLGGTVLLAPGTFNVHSLTVKNGTGVTHGFAIRGTAGSFGGTVLQFDGSAGGTIMTVTSCQWCTIDSIDFNGANSAATALSVQAQSGAGSFEMSIKDSTFHFTTTYGLLLGASNNYQVSEINLQSVHILNTVTGLQIIGTNTLNILSEGLVTYGTHIAVNVTNGNYFAYDSSMVVSSVADVTMWRTTAPSAFYGGYSENAAALLIIPYDPDQFYAPYSFQDFKFLPASPGGVAISDSSLAQATFSHVLFGTGSTVYFRSAYGPSTPAITKRFVNCLFYNNASAPISGTASVQRGSFKTVMVVFDQGSLGLVASPFASWGSDSGIDPWTYNSHSSQPTGGSPRNYTVDGQSAYVTSTGGTGVTNIHIYDAQGNMVVSGLSTLTDFYMPVGWSVNWWTFSGAPTVSVWFAGV